MARADVISKLYAKRGSALDFNYDSLVAPPIYSLINPHDLDYMYKICTSIKYTGDIDFKEKEIKKVMEYHGFKRFASGTHRVVYKHLEIPTIVAKISLNKSSLGDNIKEMHNQVYLKPFCCKCFDVQHNGLIGLFERVSPIQSREEFESIGGDIFDFLNSCILGKYVVDDIGTNSFMNYGIRIVGPYNNIPFGPVVIDYVEVYPLDGNKLFCNKIDLRTGLFCGGPLDYDFGFNTIHCMKCGCEYSARELQRLDENHEIIKKGESTNMKVVAKRGNKVIKVVDSNSLPVDTIQPPKKPSGGFTLASGARGRKMAKKVALPKKDKYAPREYSSTAPVEEKKEEVVKEEENVTKITVTDNARQEDKTQVTQKYDTESKFIPKPEEIPEPEPEEEDVNAEPEGDTAEETAEEYAAEEPAEDEYKDYKKITSTENGEIAVEGDDEDPESELGGEEYPAEEELGGEASEEPISIDPAAIAASMMGGGNPFTKRD